jgi:hypothetical protein
VGDRRAARLQRTDLIAWTMAERGRRWQSKDDHSAVANVSRKDGDDVVIAMVGTTTNQVLQSV